MVKLYTYKSRARVGAYKREPDRDRYVNLRRTGIVKRNDAVSLVGSKRIEDSVVNGIDACDSRSQ